MEILTAPLFGAKHLLGLFYILLLILGLFYISEKREIKNKDMMLYLSITFIGLEVIKLTMMTFSKGSFPMNHLPLHLCSLPLYVFPILYFSKEGSKVERFAKPTAYATVLAAAIAALVLPTNIIGNNENWFPFTDNFYPLLSFTYHGVMVFAAIYMIRSKYLKISFLDIPRAYVSTGCLMILALIANALLDKDFMLLNTGNGSPLVFLLEHGQLIYTFSMIGLGLFIIGLFIAVTTVITNYLSD